MNRSMPGLPVHHKILEFTRTHAHWVSDAIQPSHPLSSPSPPVPNPSQHQGLFQRVNPLHEVTKVLEFSIHLFKMYSLSTYFVLTLFYVCKHLHIWPFYFILMMCNYIYQIAYIWWIIITTYTLKIVVVRSLSHFQIFVTLWTAACKTFLSFTISWSLLNLMSIKLVISSSFIPFSSCLQCFPTSGSFPLSQLFTSSGQNTGVLASASVLLMNIQVGFTLGLTVFHFFDVQGKLKSLIQCYSSKPSILQCSAFFYCPAHICTWLLEKP